MDSLQSHPHSTWEALASKEVSAQHLGCCLLCSTDLLGTPTLAISLKYLLAQLGAKAGTLQPSHWLGPGEDFPFGQAVSCSPSTFTSWASTEGSAAAEAARDSGSEGWKAEGRHNNLSFPAHSVLVRLSESAASAAS